MKLDDDQKEDNYKVDCCRIVMDSNRTCLLNSLLNI